MDMSERDKLIVENQKLVFGVLHKYYPTWVNDEDLQQIGMIGLCKAADAYDPEKAKFSTLATHAILNEIKRELRKTFTTKRLGSVVSLNECITDSDGSCCTLEDYIPGDEDVDYCYSRELFKKLDEREREILELLEQGYSQIEIAKKMKISKQKVSAMCRKIQLKWRKYYAN
jgi:RNA polymerase sigma factor (sigma-70 family)